ncbi:NUDIX hydrolase domain-like protein [Xylariaceae sp. FL0016]|nr:NUDIX hydrolase domain-like protein [Xylariaceae sp. FL0016]
MAETPSTANGPAITVTSTAAPTVFALDPSSSAFNVPLHAYMGSHPGFDGIGTGAMVFNPQGKLLLLQRAAHDSFPLRWEVPGGAVDSEDETLLHAVARELWEESGLRAEGIGEALEPAEVLVSTRGLRVCKRSFIVQVNQYEVKLDPNEHEAFVWASEEEVRAKKCGEVVLEFTSPSHEQTIYNAFDTRKEKQRVG